MLSIKYLLKDLSSSIDSIAVIIIVLGVIFAIARYCVGLCGIKGPITIDRMRLELGRAIVLAVEFLLAADILRTMVAPDYYTIGLLGALVVIRTVLTYFLNLDLARLEKQSS